MGPERSLSAQGHLGVELSFLSSFRLCPVVTPEGDIFPDLTKSSRPFAEGVASYGLPTGLPSRFLKGWVASSAATARTGPLWENAVAGGSDFGIGSLLRVEILTSLSVTSEGASPPSCWATQVSCASRVVRLFTRFPGREMGHAWWPHKWHTVLDAPRRGLNASVSK